MDLSNYSAIERRRLLEANCDSSYEDYYYKELTEEELNLEKTAYSDGAIALSALENELKDIKAEYASKIKRLKQSQAKTLNIINGKRRAVNGILFDVLDPESRQMITYDALGEFIRARPLRRGEGQYNAFSEMGATGTDG